MISAAVYYSNPRLRDAMTHIEKELSAVNILLASDTSSHITRCLLIMNPEILIVENHEGADFLNQLAHWKQESPITEILVVGCENNASRVIQLFRAGAGDVVLHSWTEDQLKRAISRLTEKQSASPGNTELRRRKAIKRRRDQLLYGTCFDDRLGTERVDSCEAINMSYGVHLQDGWYQGVNIFFDPVRSEIMEFERWMHRIMQVYDCCEKFFAAIADEMVVWIEDNRISILLNAAEPIALMPERCRRFMRDVENWLSWVNRDVIVTIGIGLAFDSIRDGSKALQTARIAGLNRLVEEKGTVLVFDESLQDYLSAWSALSEEQALLLQKTVEERELQACLEAVTDIVGDHESPMFVLSCRAIALCLSDCFRRECEQHPSQTMSAQAFLKSYPRPIDLAVDTGMVLHELCIWIRQCFANLPLLSTDIDDESIRRAQQYIHANYNLPLKLEEVARHCGLAPAYLSAKFHRVLGKTFVAYLTEIRMRRAVSLLINSELSVGEIAANAGFQDTRHFSRVFRRTYGMLPTQFRKVHQHG